MSKISKMVLELLKIDEDFAARVSHLKSKMPQVTVGDETITAEPRDYFEMYSFEQLWGNTAGGFEGWGGCAMTYQQTYVFVPQTRTDDMSYMYFGGRIDNMCYVYFGGRFAYSVPYSDEFMEDVKKHSIAGAESYSKYLKGG